MIESVTSLLVKLHECGKKEWSFVIMWFYICNILIYILPVLEMSTFFPDAVLIVEGELIFVAWKMD